MTAAQTLPAPAFTVEDYLAWCDRHPDSRAELIDGDIVMMAGASYRHNVIVLNIGGALNVPMRRRGCQTFTTDMILRREDLDDFAALPDVFVRCGPPPDDRARTLADPVVIFEVLSPATARRDRTAKFANYEAIPSLLVYALVHQDEPRIEVWARGPESRVFRPRPAAHGLAAVLALPEIETELPLAVVYDGVGFDG